MGDQECNSGKKYRQKGTLCGPNTFGLYQAYLESVKTLHEMEVWSTRQQLFHPC
jgi:hypothetical protein